jgi:hypothetical protein
MDAANRRSTEMQRCRPYWPLSPQNADPTFIELQVPRETQVEK